LRREAREFAKRFGLTHVIIFGKERKPRVHVVTYGVTTEQAGEAADWGNSLKAQLGWPESLCQAQPSRVRRLEARIKELEMKLQLMVEEKTD
jgi:hypothetical protein